MPDALDLPLPPPSSGSPMTRPALAHYLMESYPDLDWPSALARVDTLVRNGFLTEWGMTLDGKPLFVGSFPVYLIVKEV